MKERLAVMDLGTNTFHLMVADVVDGKPSVVFRDRRPVKLGKGGINQGTIRKDAIDRALDCMKSFQEKVDSLQVSRSVAIGTSALRSAANGQQVLDVIRQATGIAVEVITGDKEAEYIYRGVRSAVDLGSAPALIVDIGGGSVEFIIADRKSIHWKVSLDIGAQRLMELYHRHDPMSEEERLALTGHYRKALGPIAESVARWNPSTMVGSSGTFDTLSEIYCRRTGRDYLAAAPETPLTVEAFGDIHQELISKDREGRMRIPGMIEMRVDMIVVASCLIAFLLDTYGFQRVRVSSYSLKEGVLASLISKP